MTIIWQPVIQNDAFYHDLHCNVINSKTQNVSGECKSNQVGVVFQNVPVFADGCILLTKKSKQWHNYARESSVDSVEESAK